MDREKGQVLIIGIIFMGILLVLGAGLLAFVGQNVIATRISVSEEQALQLAEGGIDKATYMLNQTAGGYTGELATSLSTGQFDVLVETISSNRRLITAIGYVPNKNNYRIARTIVVEAGIDTTSVNFNYGVQVGEGGLKMGNNSQVTGNVYSNGPIDGSSGARITGDVFSARSSGLITDELDIDGSAYAHSINDNVTIGGNAYGQVMDRVTVGGNVFTNSVSNCTVGGNVSYSTIVSCSVGGSQNPGYPGEPDPEPENFPITDEQIQDWKDSANGGGIFSGSFNISNRQQATLGPKHITGNLNISNGATVTLTGPVWVEGNINISNNAIIRLNVSYGNGSEVVIAGGKIDVSNNAIFQGAGDDSYILMISTKVGDDAFDIANNADALIAYAPYGEVDVSNNAVIREVTGWKIELSNNSEIIYESGLANLNFTSGPGASWEIVRGTWRIVD